MSCNTPKSVDTTAIDSDHHPVIVEFKSTSSGKDDTSGMKIDCKAVLDPDNRKTFVNALKGIPLAPATLDVNEHMEHMVWAFQEASRVAFPRSPQNPIKPHVTPELLAVISFRRRVRQITRTWKRQNAGYIDRLLHEALDFKALEVCQDLEVLAQADFLQEAVFFMPWRSHR